MQNFSAIRPATISAYKIYISKSNPATESDYLSVAGSIFCWIFLLISTKRYKIRKFFDGTTSLETVTLSDTKPTAHLPQHAPPPASVLAHGDLLLHLTERLHVGGVLCPELDAAGAGGRHVAQRLLHPVHLHAAAVHGGLVQREHVDLQLVVPHAQLVHGCWRLGCDHRRR